MDVPLLPPPPHPEGHGAHNNAVPFLIRQYFIKGVHDLPKELRSHIIVNYEELITLMEGASESWWLITKEKVWQYWPHWSVSMTESLWICLGQFTHKYISGVKNMPSLPAVTVLLLWHALTIPTVMPGLTKNVDVETVRRLTYFEAAYSEIWRAHGPEHMKGCTLSAHLNKHVENIGCQLYKLFTNTCPICHASRTDQHWVVRSAGWISCRAENELE